MDRVPNLKKYIPTSAMPQELRDLERRIIVLTDREAEILSGALDIEAVNGMEDIFRILRRLGNYELYNDVSTPAELGRMLVDTGKVEIHESALPYVDFTRVANEFESENGGTYTRRGYVVKVEDGVLMQRPHIVKLELSSPRISEYGAIYPLYLPAPSAELGEAMTVMAVGGFEECDIIGIFTPHESIFDISFEASEIEFLNHVIGEFYDITNDHKKYRTYCAVVEVEQPETVRQLLDILQTLDEYTLLPAGYDNADSYGRYILYDVDELDSEDFKYEVKDFIDFQKYGEYRMEEDGVQQTSLGLLRNDREPFANTAQGMTMNR